MALDAFETYGLVAAAFEIGLAILIASSGAPARMRAAFCVILVGNGYEVAYNALAALGLPASFEWIGGDLADPIIVTTILFVMTQLPAPLGGPRGARLATGLWLAAIVTWAVLATVFHGLDAEDAGRATGLGKWAFQRIPFVLAAYVLAVHVVPRWRALDPGPLRGQVLLVASACAIGLTAAGTLQAIHAFRPGGDVVQEAFQATLLVFLVPAFGLLVADGRNDARLFAAIVSMGAVFAWVQAAFETVNIAEFSSQAIRPALIAFAILRYDLVDAPGALRRIVAPVTGIAFALTLFFGLNRIFSGGSESLPPVTSALSLAIVAGGAILARRPIEAILRATGGERGDTERIERYRLALEAEAVPRVSAHLVDLRRRLHITDDEHDTLVAILKSHVVVPTRVVRGLQPGDRVAGYVVTRELGRGGQGRALLAQGMGARSSCSRRPRAPGKRGGEGAAREPPARGGDRCPCRLRPRRAQPRRRRGRRRRLSRARLRPGPHARRSSRR